MMCRWGIHHWARREATHRPGTVISRCKVCGKTVLKHAGPRPDPAAKRLADDYLVDRP